MKFNQFKSVIILALCGSTAWFGCKKDESKPATVPVLAATTAVTNITQTSATSGGNITSDGGSAILARGVCYGTNPNPTTDDDITIDGTGTGSYSSNITNLSAGMKYYVRAYATNLQGVGYGAEVSFTTESTGPVVVTGAATNILVSGATCAGSISDNGGSGQTITAKGIQYSTISSIAESDPKIAGVGPESGFTSNLTGLLTNTEYFYRAYATNSAGKTGYGNVQSFTTSSNPPATLTTGDVNNVYLLGNAALYQASATGNISNLNGGALVRKGFVWSSTNSNPTITSREGQKDITDGSLGNYTITLDGLPRLKTIYVRAFATTNFGGSQVTGYGATRTIETHVTDIDNNQYNIVRIGNQLWTKENLKVKKFNDGTAIEQVINNVSWAARASTLPAWCWSNSESTFNTQGLLYNWVTSNPLANGGKNVCPVGWNVPIVDQASVLVNSVGGAFNIISSPFGHVDTWYRAPNGDYATAPSGGKAWYWIQDGNQNTAWHLRVSNAADAGLSTTDSKHGFSIRCVKGL